MRTPFTRAAVRDATERLSPDDQATQREAEFLDRALLNQQLCARGAKVSTPGVCMNCGEGCLPLAVYCDEFCREDHETREARPR